MNLESSALVTDLYQLTMLQAYFDEGMEETAVFEFFARKLPPCRGLSDGGWPGTGPGISGTLALHPPRSWIGWRAAGASARISWTIWNVCGSPVTCTPWPRARFSFPPNPSCASPPRCRKRSSSRPG